MKPRTPSDFSYIKFWLLVLRRAFTHAIERADFIGGVIAVIGGAAAYLIPTLAGYTNIANWLGPLVAFAIFFLVRLTLAPFELFREEADSRAAVEALLKRIGDTSPSLVFEKARQAPKRRS
jgi:hypothetical protein